MKPFSIYFCSTILLSLLSCYHSWMVNAFSSRISPYKSIKYSQSIIAKEEKCFSYSSSSSSSSFKIRNHPTMMMVMSLPFPSLPTNDMWFQYALISSAAGASLHMEKTTTLGKALSAPVCSMLLSVILTNLQILPAQGSPHLRSLVDFAVKLATPMLLLNADLKRTYREAGTSLLFAFCLGTIGTIVGSITAYFIFGVHMSGGLSVAGDGWKLAIALAAKNIGGGLNYMGVASALQLSPTALATGLTVDNLLGLLYFPLVSYIGSFSLSSPATSTSMSVGADVNREREKIPVLRNESTSTTTLPPIEAFVSALSLSLAIVSVSEYVSQVIPFPAITISTILSVILASVFPSDLAPLLPASDLLGKLLLTLFFAAIGNLSGTIYNALFAPSVAPLLGFNTVLYLVHLVFVFGVGRLFNLKLDELTIASNANIGNAATASALAVSKGWSRLVVPALLVGCLGNAIGTLLGITLGINIFRKM